MIGLAVVAIRFPGPVQWLGEWLWIPTGLLLLVQLALQRRSLRLSLGGVVFGTYVLYLGISLTWSPDPMRGLRFFGLMAFALFAYLVGRAVGPPGGSSQVWRVGVIGMGVTVVGFVLLQNPGAVNHLNPNRILAMGVIALVVSAWYGPRGRVYTLIIGLVGFGLVFASGSRMAALVMTVLLLAAPGLRLPRAGRLLLLGCVAMFALVLSSTPWFQDRWFSSGEGDLWDLVTLQGVDTSGRFDVWPEIADSCDQTLFGAGAGASDSYGFQLNEGFPEPHNEYLRIWCDTGVVGTILFWGFIASAVAHSLAGTRIGGRSWAHHASLQMAAALVLMSLTDNPLTTTVAFMIPTALAIGWSEHGHHRGRGPRRRSRPHQPPGVLGETGT